jgi:hypothetical protein
MDPAHAAAEATYAVPAPMVLHGVGQTFGSTIHPGSSHHIPKQAHVSGCLAEQSSCAGTLQPIAWHVTRLHSCDASALQWRCKHYGHPQLCKTLKRQLACCQHVVWMQGN